MLGDKVECPYCFEFSEVCSDWWIDGGNLEDIEFECEECNRVFRMTIEFEPTFSAQTEQDYLAYLKRIKKLGHFVDEAEIEQSERNIKKNKVTGAVDKITSSERKVEFEWLKT